MNGFPSFEEQKSFEMIAQRRPSISKTRTKEIISYDELLAIVESKQYGSLVKTELEEYLSDEEFKHCFQIERVRQLIFFFFHSANISPNIRKNNVRRTYFAAFPAGESKP